MKRMCNESFSGFETDELVKLCDAKIALKSNLLDLKKLMPLIAANAAPPLTPIYQTPLPPPDFSPSLTPTKKKKVRQVSTRKTLQPQGNVFGEIYPKTSVTLTPVVKMPVRLDSNAPAQVLFFGGMPPESRRNLFFDMMREREHIRRQKEAGAPFPWTANPVFMSYKFTNVKRENDATTRWMREHWTGPNVGTSDFGTVIFNCAMFRYFGTTALGERLTWAGASFVPGDVVRAAVSVRRTGTHAFTRAYCRPHFNSEVTSPGQGAKCYQKIAHRYLASLWGARHALTAVAHETRSWRRLVEELRGGQAGISGFGGTGFMAKEAVLDAMHSSPEFLATIDDRNEWCPCGPGARRGLNRIFSRPTEFCINETNSAIEDLFVNEMKSLLAEAKKRMPGWCTELDLELHDVQFQLCEFDKYERVLGHGNGAVAKYLPAGQRPPPSLLSTFDEHEAEKLILGGT